MPACLQVCVCVFVCTCVFADRQQISGICARLLEEVVTMRSLWFDFALHTFNRFEGEIVAGRSERELRVVGVGGLEALFTGTLNGDGVEGGVKTRIVLHSKVLFKKRKKCAGGGVR